MHIAFRGLVYKVLGIILCYVCTFLRGKIKDKLILGKIHEKQKDE